MANDQSMQAVDPVSAATLAARPINAIAESFSRLNGLSVTTPLSGYQYLTAVYYLKGAVVTKAAFWIGNTGSTGLTHSWTGLYGSNLMPALTGAPTASAMLRQSADQTSALTAGTVFSPNFSSTYTIPVAGMYLHGLTIVATTMPTIVAANNLSTVPAGLVAAAPILGAREGSGAYTTPSGAALGTLTNVVQPLYTYAL